MHRYIHACIHTHFIRLHSRKGRGAKELQIKKWYKASLMPFIYVPSTCINNVSFVITILPSLSFFFCPVLLLFIHTCNVYFSLAFCSLRSIFLSNINEHIQFNEVLDKKKVQAKPNYDQHMHLHRSWKQVSLDATHTHTHAREKQHQTEHEKSK